MLRLTIAIAGLIFIGCQTDQGSKKSPSKAQQFFANSIRRDATESERQQVMQLPGCTGFYIENTKDTVTIVSARHCFDFAPEHFCQNGGLFSSGDGQEGRCREVIAAGDQHDIVVFRADFAKKPASEHALRLSSSVPTPQTRLKMIGYPQDPERDGKLTVTENCWVISSDGQSPYFARDARLPDRTSRHNCSTYGGNSGGPMLIEGTREVVGLPFSYSKRDLTPRQPDNVSTAAYMTRMADFVEQHREALDAAGILTAGEQMPPGAGGALDGAVQIQTPPL